LNFDRKFGIAEVISFFALIFSGYVLWTTNRANDPLIVYGSGAIATTTFKEGSECNLVLSIPVLFHNSGKQAVTLQRYVPTEISRVMLSRKDELQEVTEGGYELYLSALPAIYQDKSLWIESVRSTQKIDLKSFSYTNTLIPPNTQYHMYMVLVVNPYPNGEPDFEDVMFSADAEFGNDQIISISFTTQVEPRKNTSCA